MLWSDDGCQAGTHLAWHCVAKKSEHLGVEFGERVCRVRWMVAKGNIETLKRCLSRLRRPNSTLRRLCKLWPVGRCRTKGGKQQFRNPQEMFDLDSAG